MDVFKQDIVTFVQLYVSSAESACGVLIIDTRRCPYSKRLWEEVRISSSLCTEGSTQRVYVLDLSSCPLFPIKETWVPGIPCLITQTMMHLGVDVFQWFRDQNGKYTLDSSYEKLFSGTEKKEQDVRLSTEST